MALSPVPQLATGTMAEDVWSQFYTCQSTNLLHGAAACLLTTGTNCDATDPDNANAGPFIGIVRSAGTLTSGAYSAPAVNDALTIQRFGRAMCLLDTNQTVTRGDKIGAVPGSVGRVGAFVPGGNMRFVGVAAQSKTTTSTALYFEVDLGMPHPTQVVRTISDFVATIGAVTKYTNFGGTISTTAVPKYLVRWTGETIANLAINLTTAPGGSDTVAVTVYKSSDNGSNFTATTLTCTATGTSKTASDTTHRVSMTAGDLLAIYVNSSAGTAANLTVSFDVYK